MRHHLTPDLSVARNDTGRTAYCGPVVVAAITDFSVSRVEDEIRSARRALGDLAGAEADAVIKGTTTADVDAALGVFGYRLAQLADHQHLPAKERPTVWSWMQRPRSAFAHYVLAVMKGREGHWICVRGTKMCDTFTNGRWVFVADGPHRGARILEVFQVKRAAG
ncbi:MAG: hypothetical protein AAFQ42_11540 [Pseudomonadota bacterium]